MSNRVYFELSNLCAQVHTILYVRGDLRRAKTYVPKFKLLLRKTPRHTLAIVAAEARGIYHELCGNYRRALVSRLREVMLMERLYQSIQKNRNDRLTTRYILQRRNRRDYQKRLKIIESLRHKVLADEEF